jgi:hypothetical protein
MSPHVCRPVVEAFAQAPFHGPLPGAKQAPMPGIHNPTLREDAPTGPDEIKIDGYRAQLHIRNGRVKVYSRKGYDWTEQFGQLARAAKALAAHDLIIDGEATVLGNTGLPDFQALRRERPAVSDPTAAEARSAHTSHLASARPCPVGSGAISPIKPATRCCVWNRRLPPTVGFAVDGGMTHD